jgi:hypothetical protein
MQREDPQAGEAVRVHLTLSVDLILEEAARYARRLASVDSLMTESATNNEGSSG